MTIIRRSVAAESVASDSMQRISEINMARCDRWHSPGSRQWSLSEWAVAVTGELGEACNIIKKLNRAHDGVIGNKETESELHVALEKEIADTFIYLDLLASHSGLDLFTAVRAKFNETSEKHGFPERL